MDETTHVEPTHVEMTHVEMTTLVGASEIAHRVGEMAEDIVDDFGCDLVMMVMLDNGFVFAGDLVRALGRAGASVAVGFVHVGDDGAVTVSSLPAIAGRNVLVVDAIIDTGRSAGAALLLARARGAAEARLAVLLDRPARESRGLVPDYAGFVLPDRYVVGYGIDDRQGRFRERADVAAYDRT